MQLSERGKKLIQDFESCRLEAYWDAADPPVLTIGWGHTGSDVYEGQSISQAVADELLDSDLQQFEDDVNRLVAVPLNQNEFDALVSFEYNTGGLAHSTLLRKLNAGDRAAAAAEFPRWNRGGGRVLAGLVRRRAAERELFLRP